jgi:hypothetical protein
MKNLISRQNGLDLSSSVNILRQSMETTIVTSDKIHKTPYLYADSTVTVSSKNENLGHPVSTREPLPICVFYAM